MIRRLFLFFAISALMVAHPAFATDEFEKNNPDIKKYEFARSYITALSYMKDIYQRWNKNAPKKHFAEQKDKLILAEINELSLDSSDLLIIKSYMHKYLLSPNILMRKVADIIIVATSQQVAISNQEKTLWEKWYDLFVAKQVTREKEIQFVKTQYAFELQRKETDKQIVKASILMTKVLMSDKNKDGKGHLLAITAQQRQKLLDKLDSFGGDTLDWGLKKGQRSLEGSIAVIREILEDSIWISIDDK